VALKSAQQEPEKVDIEEALEILDKMLDRVKALYEQYFLGIQKQPPTFIHADLERKLRDLAAIQIRNTGLRYRYATMQQKYGSYNTYWRRTLRQIENGTYARSLQKLGRKAALTGEAIPEEILAKMPKRMREQIKRDREAVLARERRRERDAGEGDFYDEYDDRPAPRADTPRDARGAHILDEADAELDLEALFASVAEETAEPTHHSLPPAPPGPDPEFDDIATPPAPIVPQAPAPLRAATLGFAPRAASPALRPTPQPFPAVTPTTTPGSFAPVRRDTGPQPAFGPRATTVPGVAPNRPSQPSTDAPTDPPARARTLNPPGDASQSGRMFAPSQGVRPNPIAPGSSRVNPVGVETMEGPFVREPSVAVPPRRSKRDTDVDQGEPAPPPDPRPITPIPTPPTMQRQPTPPSMRPTPTPPSMRQTPTPPSMRPTRTPPNARPVAQRPPPGMTDADVHALYTNYVKAKEMVGEPTGPQTYGKLLNTINAQAPRIMEQYRAKGVDFSVVVKDNQVIIRAKPK